jgi:hypothetical protein
MAMGNRIDTGPPDAGPPDAGHCGHLRRQWNAWRRPPALPPRMAVSPRDLGATLGHVLLLERGPQGAVIRLAGQSVCDAVGRDLCNLRLADLFDRPALARLDTALTACFDQPAAVDLHLRLVNAPSGIPPDIAPDPKPAARMLVLPLARASGRADAAIACLDLAALPRRPRLLSLGAVLRQPLGGAAHLRLVHSRD